MTPSELHGLLVYRVKARLDVADRAATQDHGANLRGFSGFNDPARIIRDCERDLRVLDRHQYKRYALSPEDDDQAGYCATCIFGDYPCDEILDLAREYEVNPGEG